MTLAEFLAARLDEDETAAKAAPGCEWRAFTRDDIAGDSVYDEQWLLLNPTSYDHDNALSDKPGATGPMYIERARDELCAHIARHDPARVLREVAAKRAIVALHVDAQSWSYPPGDGDEAVQETLEEIIRHLTAVYSDHPDYREEWKP